VPDTHHREADGLTSTAGRGRGRKKRGRRTRVAGLNVLIVNTQSTHRYRPALSMRVLPQFAGVLFPPTSINRRPVFTYDTAPPLTYAGGIPSFRSGVADASISVLQVVSAVAQHCSSGTTAPWSQVPLASAALITPEHAWVQYHSTCSQPRTV